MNSDPATEIYLDLIRTAVDLVSSVFGHPRLIIGDSAAQTDHYVVIKGKAATPLQTGLEKQNFDSAFIKWHNDAFYIQSYSHIMGMAIGGSKYSEDIGPISITDPQCVQHLAYWIECIDSYSYIEFLYDGMPLPERLLSIYGDSPPVTMPWTSAQQEPQDE